MAEPARKISKEGRHAKSASGAPDGALSTTEEDELPAVTGPARPLPPVKDDDADTAPKKPLGPEENTLLHKVIGECWGEDYEIADLHLQRLRLFADPKTAKKTEKGFSIETKSGALIEWKPFEAADGKPAGESITGDKKNFGPAEAAAIIALARIRGWDSIDVQGSPEQKDMLWLATQVQGLEERKEYIKVNGSDEGFKPPIVANHTPDPNSQAAKDWQKMWDEFQASRTDLAPAVAETAKGPAPDAATIPLPGPAVPPRPDGKFSLSEMTWLESQRNELKAKHDFLDQQAAGKIPADAEFKYLGASKYVPEADSEVRKTWESERADIEAKRAEKTAVPPLETGSLRGGLKVLPDDTAAKTEVPLPAGDAARSASPLPSEEVAGRRAAAAAPPRLDADGRTHIPYPGELTEAFKEPAQKGGKHRKRPVAPAPPTTGRPTSHRRP